MEISVKQSNQLKVLAIFMMLGLHLFNINFEGNYTPVLFVGDQPLIFYVSYFFDICVPVFAFVSGYGLYSKYAKDKKSYPSENKERLKKLYLNLWVIILIFPIILGSILQTPSMPGSMAELLLNLTAIKVSYSPIWWYFTTYVILVITSPFLFYAVFILSAKYPLFIFVLLLICSLISSYIVNFIYNKLIKLI